MIAIKLANTEPIPGYRLIEPIGKGGWGEVWKCEAPGGLFKAIKFVFGDATGLHSGNGLADFELQAVHRTKAIRHPFLLSMDRVEVIDGDLVIVMELADQNLEQMWVQYRKEGKPGIPRAELLRLLAEAAEVLDLMIREHQLQHLDVKPHNLFLVSKHIKVGDFGLVTRVGPAPDGKPAGQFGPITPLYASPEVFRGEPSPFSDQYSLAIVYHQLLTGFYPFEGKNSRQLMLLHSTQEPKLERLDAADRRAVARALAKEPQRRFASCMEFIASLHANNANVPVAGIPGQPRQALTDTHFGVNLGKTIVPTGAAPPTTNVSATYRKNLTLVMREIMDMLGKTIAGQPGLTAPSLTHAKDTVRYKFRLGLTVPAACEKLDLFVAQCFGSVIREDERGRGFTVPMPSNSLAQLSGRQPALEVQVILDRLAGGLSSPIEVAAELRAIGCGKQEAPRRLREMGMPLLDSLRAHLLVESNRPAQQRLPWSRPMLVRAVYADGRHGQPIACQSKDVSLSGIGFILPCELDSSDVLIDFPSVAHPPAIIVPGTLVRARLCPDGSYEVGALFRLPALGTGERQT